MPIFEYLCDDCGTKFEKLVRSTSQNGIHCPSCGQDHLTTQISRFAAHSNGAAKEAEPMPSCGAGMCCGGNGMGGPCQN